MIAPGIAGAFGAIIFLVTEYGVMKRKNPVRMAFITVPIYVAFTTGILTSKWPIVKYSWGRANGFL